MADETTDPRRLQMVNAQLRTSDINDLDILAAFEKVPREKFVRRGQESLAYADGEAPAWGPKGRNLLSPRALGLLLKTAAPKSGERALTVGAGSGYAAALLAELGLSVVALESDATAARAATQDYPQIEHVEGPLDHPPPLKGRFDVIVINGAFETPPDALVAALADNGRLVGVDARSGAKRVALFERSGEGVSERTLYDACADVLPGLASAPAFAF
jgi:protein-L-isoaspartate(D-aspartate) O-methyltransferase